MNPRSVRAVFSFGTGRSIIRSTPAARSIKGVDLHVRRGEVVGIAGLMGAGRTELAMSIFGQAYGRNVSRHRQHGWPRNRRVNDPEGDRDGLAYVTEDRKHLGLILNDDIRKNVTLANLHRRRYARRY